MAASDRLELVSPLQGTVVTVSVAPGDVVRPAESLVVIESMKMEHVVAAETAGVVVEVLASVGETVVAGATLVLLDRAGIAGDQGTSVDAVDLDLDRADLAEVIERHAFGLDEQRPEAVARRRASGQRTTRENVEDLCDDGTFVEYGALALAAQRRRRSVEELIQRTPADGLVAGIGDVGGHPTVVLSYDYTVLAGTQGFQNHRKKDRLFELAERWRRPVVFFTEGGGGRPGDTDAPGVSGLDTMAFHLFARLSGLVPLVGIASGKCFAGNAALLGCCDVVIATDNANIGMGGPAMIEGGGLGVHEPTDIGPMSVQVPNGVVDIAVRDEAEAVAVAKRYLGYFAEPVTAEWGCRDQRALRHIVPENRVRAYEIRDVVFTLADTDSVLELRAGWGHGMVTAFARDRGACRRHRGQQPDALGWSDRCHRRRQSGAVHAAVRRVRCANPAAL